LTDLRAVVTALGDAGFALDMSTARPVGGGCIHAATRLDGADGPLFLKTCPAASGWQLEAEADGLAGLAEAGCLRVPAVLAGGTASGTSWLALEWLELRSSTARSDAALGAALARQHLAGGDHFGWRRDNAIGATPQPNACGDDWAEFFALQRIGAQAEMGARGGWPPSLVAQARRLQARVPALLAGRRPVPALLHGDLWSGNRAADPQGAPVVFDPAVHYGDAECDLAMARLFGGFAPDFFAAYDEVLPSAPGRDGRVRLYQLYHVMNHATLFGGAYFRQAAQLIERLLAESAQE